MFLAWRAGREGRATNGIVTAIHRPTCPENSNATQGNARPFQINQNVIKKSRAPKREPGFYSSLYAPLWRPIGQSAPSATDAQASLGSTTVTGRRRATVASTLASTVATAFATTMATLFATATISTRAAITTAAAIFATAATMTTLALARAIVVTSGAII